MEGVGHGAPCRWEESRAAAMEGGWVQDWGRDWGGVLWDPSRRLKDKLCVNRVALLRFRA